MTVNKAQLIAQIISSEGLTGDKAKARAAVLEKLQLSQLQAISNKIQQGLSNSNAQSVGFKSFVELPNAQAAQSVGNTVFGGGLVNPDNNEIFGLKPSQARKEPVYTEGQKLAMEFLTGNLSAAKQNMADREKEAGPLSSVVNTWKEVFDKELAKSTVKKQIASTDADVSQLEKAGRGEITRFNYAANKQENISFEETFQKQRGVKFSQQNIEDCQEKSEIFARVKTSKQMVDNLKSQLAHYTAGTVDAAMDTTGASKTIYDIFKTSGVDHSTYMNQALAQIGKKYKDHPDVKKYGGEFQFEQENGKIKNPPTLLRRAGNGTMQPVTTEGLRVIAKELTQNLNTAYANALGAEIPQGSTNEQIEKIAQGKYDQYQKEYENSFATAYGKKDLKALSERYIAEQQKGVENIEMGINIASMAMMVVPGGAVATANLGLRGALVAKNSATLGNVAKGLSLVDKARKGVVGAQKLASATQKLSPVIMGNMIARPVYLADQLMSENGMSADEWEQWGVGVLQSSAYMALGMGSGKLAEQGAAMYKTKALVNTLKQSGKSADEIAAMIKANPVKFPKDIVQSFGKINTTAKALQIPTEVALDLGSTYAMNKALNNGELQTQDWVNSLMFAINGGVLQKQFMPLTKDAKADFLVNAFKDYGMAKDEAFNVLKTMDDVSSGKIRVRKSAANAGAKQSSVGNKPSALPEVEITAPAVKTPAFAELLQKSDVQVNTKRHSRAELKEKLMKSGTEILGNKSTRIDEKGFSVIEIPRSDGMAAPSSKFAETDKAFADIVKSNKFEMLKLHTNYQISGDKKTFIKDVYNLFCKEMGIEGIAPRLKIADLEDGGYFLSENREIGIDIKNSEDFLVQAITHELNHFIQFKEMIYTSKEGLEIYAYNRTVAGLKGENLEGFTKSEIDEIFNEAVNDRISSLKTLYDDLITDKRYPRNTNPQSPFFQKANQYFDATSKYTGVGNEYNTNFMEVESKQRGILVENTYKSIKNELSIESEAIGKILSRCQNLDNDSKIVLSELAIENLQKPEFAEYEIDQFVNWFLRQYISQ